MINITQKKFTYNPDAQLLADFVNYKDLAKEFADWVKQKDETKEK